MEGLAGRIPWWGKLAAKLVLSRIPLAYSVWRRIGVFRHGEMRDADYATSIFRKHVDAVRPLIPKPFVLLELGPGDSVATAPLALEEGASETYLVDSAPFASRGLDAYAPLLARLGEGLPMEVREAGSLDELLRACRATYFTTGLESLRAIPSASVDFVFSNAVLEHVRRSEFDEVVRELFRLQKPGGVASHQIDFRDHLGSSLHNLRFSEAVWESRVFRESGFYTNRLAPSEVLSRFGGAGYVVVGEEREAWSEPPLPRERLHPAFRERAFEDLTTAGLHLVVRRPAS